VRGQEYDVFKAEITDPAIPAHIGPADEQWGRQYWINRKYIQTDEDHPQLKTFRSGMEFIKINSKQDRWFLQIEAFDPHEPFLALQRYRDLYPHDYDGPHLDWPVYGKVRETPEQIAHCRYEYAALLSMCDDQLGQVLDLMDELELWQDTMLIVNTDHGFLLSEHDFWGKNSMPCYNEISHIPLFVWDPRSGGQGSRCSHLVQNIDLAPTLLDYFGVNVPEDMQGKPLAQALEDNQPLRQACLFGYYGGYVNCTDGRYVFMRATEDAGVQLYQYTLMPVSMKARYKINGLQALELADPFPFTKGCKTLKIKGGSRKQGEGTLLFDLEQDPGQLSPLSDPQIEAYMIGLMVQLMKDADAPPEQFARLGVGH
jgi:membrane-anchored protein YejM (alkaline phosphatase superfamily)